MQRYFPQDVMPFAFLARKEFIWSADQDESQIFGKNFKFIKIALKDYSIH